MVVPAITDLDMDTFDEKKDSQASPLEGFLECVFTGREKYWENEMYRKFNVQNLFGSLKTFGGEDEIHVFVWFDV